MEEEFPSRQAVLCAEIVGGVRLHEKLPGNEAMRAIDRCLKRMERVVEAFEGRVVRVVGDELMAIFWKADDACQSAVEMQQRVHDLPPVSGIELGVRVGLSFGEVCEGNGQCTGPAVVDAARLAGTARPGQVLASEPAYDAWRGAHRGDLRRTVCLGSGGEIDKNGVYEIVSVTDSTVTRQGLGPSLKEKGGGSLNVAPGEERVAQPRFKLQYQGRSLLIDAAHPRIRLGRDAESDVVIRDRRASRHHAVIELRNGTLVLVDASTNGTFVTQHGKREFFVHREECLLNGKGVISFAASAGSVGSDLAEYEAV
ncbi:adenylate/guanylate cyclase domain-containing protein [Propionivibrio limicola]|uniref:adenylate/guanylate cyclase domain-containing protein n=1 Tax=Propionivibrio limicola TaxID=167645 RepID=UPI001FEA6799|nr:adenylate/guanylate cyclase domain-containing protein [Propionivibrio limicola]